MVLLHALEKDAKGTIHGEEHLTGKPEAHAYLEKIKGGIEAAEAYVGTLTEDSVGMKGLLALMQRLDKEKIARWMAYNRGVEEKEGLAAENKELMERNGQLEKNAVQDQGRIRDLQKQIEQLKNIENIIKNRDR